MPEILDYPDIGIGDEVGVSIVYFAAPSTPSKEPTWGYIWTVVRHRMRLDYRNFIDWLRAKWPIKRWVRSQSQQGQG